MPAPVPVFDRRTANRKGRKRPILPFADASRTANGAGLVARREIDRLWRGSQSAARREQQSEQNCLVMAPPWRRTAVRVTGSRAPCHSAWHGSGDVRAFSESPTSHEMTVPFSERRHPSLRSAPHKLGKAKRRTTPGRSTLLSFSPSCEPPTLPLKAMFRTLS